jgi:lipoprotein-anchoring transpeptidase ErfK/SrfK
VPGSAGFSIHGTYWHNNFGHAMSHGCVNMKTTDVAQLFEWADGPIDGKKGTTITIYGD